jgi:PAS domain S-box-containing protein
MSKKSYKSEGKTRVLLNLLSDPAVIIDQKGLFLMANDEFGKETGLNPKELIGKPFLNLDILPAKSKAVLLENLSAKLQDVNVTPYEIQFTNASGEARFVEVKGKIISYAGQPADLVVFHDVTRTKENARRLKEYAERMEALVAEKIKEIKESEEKFRAISTYAKDAIVAADSEGEIVYWNPAAERIFGYSQEEAVGKNVLNLLVPPRHYSFQQKFVELAQSSQLLQGEIIEFTALRKDGTEFPAELSAALMNFKGKSCLIGIVRDVSERKRTEEAMKQSETRYRSLFESSFDGVMLTKPDGTILSANPQACRMLDMTEDEIKKAGREGIVVKDEKLATALEERELTGRVRAEFTFRRKDGTTFVGEVASGISTDSEGVIKTSMIIRDITERKQAEESLRKERQDLDCIIDSSPIIIFYKDKEGKFIRANKTFAEALKTPKEDFLGKTVFDLYPAEIAQGMANDDSEVLKSGRPKLGIIEQYESASGIRWVQTDKVPIFDKNGAPVGLVGFAQDITEQKKGEQALRGSEKYLEEILSSVLTGVLIIDEKTHQIVDANPNALETIGASKEHVIGKVCHRFICPAEKGKCPISDLGQTVDGSERVLFRVNGERVPILKTVTTTTWRGRKYLVESFLDISKRKWMEEQLRESEEKYRELINGMNDTAWVIDFDANFIDVNDAAVKVLGYSREELLSMGPTDIDSSLSREQIRDLVKRMPADQVQVFETAHTTKDGKKIPVEISSSLVTYQGKQAVLSIARNITERKKTEENLRVSEERFRAISNSVRDAIILVNDKAEIEYWNPAAEKTFGYAREEAFGQKVHDLVVPSSMCPEGKMQLIRGSEQFAQTGTGAFIGENVELIGRRKDGTEFPVKLSLSPIKLGNKWHAVGVAKDITEKKQNEQMIREYSDKLEKAIAARTNELQIAQESLLKLERLAAIGELAGMVGHDLRNPLTGIKNAAYYLEVKQGSCLDDNSKKMLEIIDNAIAHADKIIGDLQDYSREMQLELTNCSPRSILKEASSMIRVPDRVKIVDSTLDKPLIRADKTKMVRVFINIIKNAVDAMPEGGTLQIRSAQTDGSVEISFADTGIGIPKENLGKLFSPLVTTKAQGMGFGLAICKRILEAHQGRITVQSVEGKGSTFTLTIPIKPKLEDGGETTWVNLSESLLSTTTKT